MAHTANHEGMTHEDLEGFFISAAESLGIRLTKEESGKFMEYMALLSYWNQRINLTAIRKDRDVIIKHFCDSLTLFTLPELHVSGARVIDVGTGAGLPGIPVSIRRPDWRVDLLDSLKKRGDFLERVKESLRLDNIRVLTGRAEDFGRDPKYREQYDFCVSRAVAPLPVLCEYCLPFVAEGGLLIAMKGPGARSEAEISGPAAELLGGSILDIREIRLPETLDPRSLIMIRKICQTPLKYPRKAGKATKSPLK